MRLNNYGYKDSGNYNCYNNLSPVAVLITLLRLIPPKRQKLGIRASIVVLQHDLSHSSVTVLFRNSVMHSFVFQVCT